MERRSFLAGMLAAAAGPAIVRAGVLMPVHIPLPRFRYEFLKGGLFEGGGFVVAGVSVLDQTGHLLSSMQFKAPMLMLETDVLNLNMSLADGKVRGSGSWEMGSNGEMLMQCDPLAGVHPADLQPWPFPRR